ncbi:hypothetical protein HF086_001407 [Spodoptera exigua]|uniref:Endonuclease/exonuclease/phosphatase domain-containing protein n=1 Tax=Spodoptera exigua TaxID=7107 RepID=A0A922SE14_SPOEX|nr:hypothetical protein HF086_001407 [Spodoptera exigua]
MQSLSIPGNTNLDNHLFEMVCATIHRNNKFICLCIVAYIPPNACESEYMLMFHLMEQLCIKYEKTVLVADLNMYSANQNVQCYYEYFITYCGFRQCNNICNCNNRTLDVVLTTFSSEDLQVAEASESLSCIDPQHPPLYVALTNARECIARSQHAARPFPATLYPRWNFAKADFYSLYIAMSQTDWNAVYEAGSVNEAYVVFYDLFYKALDESTPRKKPKVGGSRYQYPEWYTA